MLRLAKLTVSNKLVQRTLSKAGFLKDFESGAFNILELESLCVCVCVCVRVCQILGPSPASQQLGPGSEATMQCSAVDHPSQKKTLPADQVNWLEELVCH